MKLRALTAGTALTVASVFGGSAVFAAVDSSPAAAARPPVKATATTPCTVAGVATTCTLQVTSVQLVNHTLQAAGTATGGGVTAPFSGVPIDPPASSCSVLALTLGPLHLDLLGLVVDLNQVNLNITAVPGPGNLLGNLLCSVAGLLNNTGAANGVTSQLSHINSILAAA
jgi:hypothetical protein